MPQFHLLGYTGAYPLLLAPPPLTEPLQQWRPEAFACLKGCGFCQGPQGDTGACTG